MKKRIFSILLFIAVAMNMVRAQDTDVEFGKLVLTPHVNEKEKLPAESASALTRKLEQIISKSGAVARDIGTVYVLSAEISIGTKDIVPGPPQMIAQNLELTLRVGDSASGISFSMVSIPLRGVGTNENKSILEAIKAISLGNKEIQECLEKGKAAIVDYYKNNCSKLIDAAASKAQSGNHDEAIYMLSLIPDACPDCYAMALESSQMFYQAKINLQSAQDLQAAKSSWSVDPTETGAARAAEFLQKINPYSSSFDEAQKLSKSIRKKFEAQQQAEWNFKLKQYEDAMTLKREEQRIAEENAKRDDLSRDEQQKRQNVLEKMGAQEYSAVAQEYARNLPKTVTNTYIVWR
jgi:hypothetical protein